MDVLENSKMREMKEDLISHFTLEFSQVLKYLIVNFKNNHRISKSIALPSILGNRLEKESSAYSLICSVYTRLFLLIFHEHWPVILFVQVIPPQVQQNNKNVFGAIQYGFAMSIVI